MNITIKSNLIFYYLFCLYLCFFDEPIEIHASSAVSVSRDTAALARSYQKLSLSQYSQGMKLIQLLKIKPGEKILDIGCGTGELTAYSAQLCAPRGIVVGIDPSPYRIDLARKKRIKYCSFQVASSDNLSAFPSNHFDVVYLNYVFHWIADKKSVLKEIFRILKPGGRLGITMGDKQQNSTVFAILMTSIKETMGKIPYGELVTPYYISKEQLLQLANQCGYSVDSLTVEENIHYLNSPTEVIEFFEASDFGNFLGGIPQQTKTKIIHKMKEKLAQISIPGRGIEMKYRTLIFVGHKPKNKSSPRPKLGFKNP